MNDYSLLIFRVIKIFKKNIFSNYIIQTNNHVTQIKGILINNIILYLLTKNK